MPDHRTHILVTGATGRVGRALVADLAARGVHVRAGSRHPPPPTAYGVEPVRVDLTEPATLERAAEGVDAVFLLWPFFTDGEQAREPADVVAGILGEQTEHVVYLSSQTAEAEPHGMFGVVEAALAARVDSWTMLRPTGFAGNALTWAPQIRAGDVVRWPFGRLARPLIHERDIAAVATVALLDPALGGRRPVITGPERVTQERQVALIGDALGRPLSWHDLDRAEAGRQLGVPSTMLDAWQGFLVDPEPVTDEVRRLTGRPARTFAAWARDHAAGFATAERPAG